MSVYVDLRNSVYNSLHAILPTTQIVQAYGNGPEPVSTYVTFDIQNIDQIGREYISTFADVNGTQQIVSQFMPKIKIEVIGKQDAESNFAAATLAEELYFKLNYTSVQELFQKNNLAYQRKSSLRVVPKKRETDWYMCYQMDVIFGYQVVTRQDIDIIESVTIEGTYTHNDYDSFTTTIQIP